MANTKKEPALVEPASVERLTDDEQKFLKRLIDERLQAEGAVNVFMAYLNQRYGLVAGDQVSQAGEIRRGAVAVEDAQ